MRNRDARPRRPVEGVGEPLARQDSGPPQGAGNPLRRHIRQHKLGVGDGNSDGLLSPGVHEDYVVDAGREHPRHRTDLPPARGTLHRRKALVGHHVGHSPRKLVGPPARNTQRGMLIQHDGDDVEPHRRGVARSIEDNRGRVYREETPLGIGVGTRTDVAVDELAPEDAVGRYEDGEQNQQKQQKPHATKKLRN